MTTKQPKVPSHPGQGRRMQIEESLVGLVAVAIFGIAMYATGINSPIGFALAAMGSLIAMAGVYRALRGSQFEYLENAIGPSLFTAVPEAEGARVLVESARIFRHALPHHRFSVGPCGVHL
ncbi:hypothetical protein [Rhodococcus qingshengii]|uniref:hypothetical protein n=1 Tax=Rhodococcus qingshengii TaxID=334542 RepID=UPI00301AE8BC